MFKKGINKKKRRNVPVKFCATLVNGIIAFKKALKVNGAYPLIQNIPFKIIL